jgi:hypothetical protein
MRCFAWREGGCGGGGGGMRLGWGGRGVSMLLGSEYGMLGRESMDEKGWERGREG